MSGVGRHLIQIKTEAEIVKMRAAGLVVAETLEVLRAAVQPGITTRELDAIAEREIRSRGAIPSFKGYHGFPATICTSINDEIVHGIPGDRRLQDGDVVSLDCGAILDGWHGDSAITIVLGEAAPEIHTLVDTCESALWAGIATMRTGGRLRDIGVAIEDHVRAVGDYGIVREYGGHGIGTEMHQEPHVLNYRTRARGPRLQPGLVLAIEPMINHGSPATQLLDDGWTVKTVDGSLSAHFEHSVAITEAGPLVLTALDGGARQLAGLGASIAGPATR